MKLQGFFKPIHIYQIHCILVRATSFNKFFILFTNSIERDEELIMNQAVF